MDVGKDWLENILKKKAYEESPIKVLELEDGDSGPGKGENYLSQINKIRAKVLLGSGKIKTVSFLVKREHETENMKKMSVDGGVFVREITMYRDIFPKMQELLEEINDPEGIFWAKCYDVRLYNRLVFEDLAESGFRTGHRLKQLSLNAVLMAVKHFAKFHALSKILLDKGEIPMAIFAKNVWMKDDDSAEMSKKMFSSNIKKMSKKMETWGDECNQVTFTLEIHALLRMAEGKDWLEAILKKKAYEQSPIKVLEMETRESGIPRGENYLSTIERVKAKVLLGSGKVKNLSLLIKNEHKTPHLKQYSIASGVFAKEITMYRDVLPKMEALLEEIGEDEVLWPKCYEARLYDRLVFEDLTAQGYKLLDRKKQLGLEGALLVTKVLAKFHALSKILLERGEIPLATFEKNIWNRDLISRSITSNRNNLVKVMEKWGEEWKEVINRLNADDLTDKYVDALSLKPEEFSVLCHGDPWLNNMLFRGNDPERPDSVKLLDMQIAIIMSPAKDISYFFVTAIKQDVREQDFDVLIQAYVDTLKTYLTKLGYEGRIPDAEEIKKALDSRGIMWLCEAIMLTPAMLGDHEDMPDLEELMDRVKAPKKGEESGEVWNVYETLCPPAERIIKAEIRRAMDTGLI